MHGEGIIDDEGARCCQAAPEWQKSFDALNVARNQDTKRRVGLLAFGDSITNGGGELQWGVALQSWAMWVARALGLPFTTYATDGARWATC